MKTTQMARIPSSILVTEAYLKKEIDLLVNDSLAGLLFKWQIDSSEAHWPPTMSANQRNFEILITFLMNFKNYAKKYLTKS